ncbi:MAG: pilus assembly protein [Acidimicrobiales bacterium]|nr:pilus assembly protein [Acidimicrobiales bacterium]
MTRHAPNQRPRDARQSERGSASVWMMTMALAAVLLVGLAVDATGQVHATQRAQSIAAEAARAAGQHLHSTAIRGETPLIDPATAVAAAHAYLSAAPDITGTAQITSPTQIVVTTQSSYQTKFLSLIGITSLPARGRAEVQINRAVEGAPR